MKYLKMIMPLILLLSACQFKEKETLMTSPPDNPETIASQTSQLNIIPGEETLQVLKRDVTHDETLDTIALTNQGNLYIKSRSGELVKIDQFGPLATDPPQLALLEPDEEHTHVAVLHYPEKNMAQVRVYEIVEGKGISLFEITGDLGAEIKGKKIYQHWKKIRNTKDKTFEPVTTVYRWDTEKKMYLEEETKINPDLVTFG